MSASASVLWIALVTAPALRPDERKELQAATAKQIESKWDEAAQGYRRLLESRPDFIPARLYLAETLWQAGKSEEARDALRSARAAAPELLLPLLLLAHLYQEEEGALARELPEPALRARLQDAIRLDRERFVSVGLPALHLLSWGATEVALKDYRRAVEADPNDPLLHRQIGNGFLKARRPLEASEAFQRLAALAPKDADAWRQLGVSYLFLLRWDSAIAAFEKCLAQGGDEPAALLALGYAFERKAELDRAFALYRKAARLASSSAQPHYRIGRALIEANRLAEAEEALRRAAALDPQMAEAACYLGALYLKRGELPAATRELERAVSLNPRYFEAYYHLAQVHRRAGREEEARRALSSYERLKREQRGASLP